MFHYKLRDGSLDPEYIRMEAFHLVSQMQMRSRTVAEIVASLSTAAVSSIDATRTVTLIIHQMLEILSWRTRFNPFHRDTRCEVMDVAIATFINCWRREVEGWLQSTRDLVDSDNAPDTDAEEFLRRADPWAVTAYIGDLYAMEVLPDTVLHVAVEYLISNMKTRFHLQSLELLLTRSNSYTAPTIEPSCLFAWLSTIRKKCDLSGELRNGTKEQADLIKCIYRLIAQQSPLYEDDSEDAAYTQFVRLHRAPAWTSSSMSTANGAPNMFAGYPDSAASSTSSSPMGWAYPTPSDSPSEL